MCPAQARLPASHTFGAQLAEDTEQRSLDLHFTNHNPSEEEKAAVDSILGPPDSGWLGGVRQIETEGRTSSGGHAARANRHLLLPALHGIHSHLGWISPGALNYACRRLNVPPADAFGVADFYSLFSVQPRPPHLVHVCDDISCLTRGAGELCEKLEKTFGPAGSANSNSSATWLRSPCIGLCERAPAALVARAGKKPWEKVLAPADFETVAAALETTNSKLPVRADEFDAAVSAPQVGHTELRLLKRVGAVDPESLSDYRIQGGYQALARALELGSTRVIHEVTASKLLGRGGAAFPAGVKWKAVAEAEAPCYIICNADESEPGTFKDRILMEADPFAVVEAMTIAGAATGCERGFIYIRGEYPLATERISHAIEQARTAGLLGNRVSGHDMAFDIELRRGAGAYICGEETALFNSIEGYRGEPRNKPPYPTQAGLFGRPTLVNNVETLVNVLPIILEGGTTFASAGTERSTGTKLFCVSGHIAQPGIYEAEFGTTLREMIELAGGVAGSGRLQAILLGGAAGAFVAPNQLDTPLTFEGTRAIGATLGSAVVMLFDDTVDLKKILLRVARFFRDESCGQCVPCRVGTVRQEEILHRLERDCALGSTDRELVMLKEIAQVMRDASICGLGHTASNAIESALEKWKVFQQQ